MAHVVKIETIHEGEISEKTTLLQKTSEYTISDQKKIIERMVKILKKKGKKDNWMTGLGSSKTLNEQFEDVLDKDIPKADFNFFKTLVPKGAYGTNAIVTVIFALVEDWYNRLD